MIEAVLCKNREDDVVIKKLNDVPEKKVEGYEGISKHTVIGRDDGSREISLRYFSLKPGSSTPHHAHPFPHLVKIESGAGSVTDESGGQRALQTGDYVYVKDNEIHHFTNTATEQFDFICIVPDRGES